MLAPAWGSLWFARGFVVRDAGDEAVAYTVDFVQAGGADREKKRSCFAVVDRSVSVQGRRLIDHTHSRRTEVFTLERIIGTSMECRHSPDCPVGVADFGRDAIEEDTSQLDKDFVRHCDVG